MNNGYAVNNPVIVLGDDDAFNVTIDCSLASCRHIVGGPVAAFLAGINIMRC